MLEEVLVEEERPVLASPATDCRPHADCKTANPRTSSWPEVELEELEALELPAPTLP